jgi:pSer/pThr/pTyr-binding forkhead associated (FHA) protein
MSADEERTQIFSEGGERTRLIPTPPNRETPRLLFLTGPRQGAEILLDHFPFTLGRSPRNDLVIPLDTVSAFHARILYEEGRYLIEDLHSRNGTYVGGRRIEERVELRGGEEITLGEASLRFYPRGSSFSFSPPPREEEDTATGSFPLAMGEKRSPRKRILLLLLLVLIGAGAFYLFLPSSPPSGERSLAGKYRSPGAPNPLSSSSSPSLSSSTPATSVPSLSPSSETASPSPATSSVVASAQPSSPFVSSTEEKSDLPSPKPSERRVISRRGKQEKTEKKGPVEEGAPPAPPRSPVPELKKRVMEITAGGRWSELPQLASSSDLEERVRGDLLLIATDPRDLPHLLKQLQAIRRLEEGGWIGEPGRRTFMEDSRRRMERWVIPLLNQGNYRKVSGIVEELRRFGLEFPRDHSIYRALHERAEQLFHAGYSLERVNPSQARGYYEEGLAIAPPGDDLKERIRRRLDALR